MTDKKRKNRKKILEYLKFQDKQIIYLLKKQKDGKRIELSISLLIRRGDIK